MARPRAQRRVARWTVFFAGLVLIVVHANGSPVPVCRDLSPCQPSAVGSFLIGLLLAAVFAGAIHVGAAARIGAAFVLLFIPADRLINPDPPSPIWIYALDVGFVGLCFAMARIRPWRSTPSSERWLATVTRAPLPAIDVVSVRPGLPSRLTTVGCVGLALVTAGWSWYAQSAADDQQRAATRVTGVVVAQPDEFTIRVRVPGLDDADIPVLNPADHPVGQRLDLYVDGDGLRQPVSEPYDATPWLALGIVLAGIGVAAWRRGRDKALPRHQLLVEEQPVTQVYLRPGYGVVAVYPADARAGEPAIAEVYGEFAAPEEVPLAAHSGLIAGDDWDLDGYDDLSPDAGADGDGPNTGADGDPEADYDDEDDAADYDDVALGRLPSTRPGRLYGVPVPGAWCAIEVNGETVVANAPLKATRTAPPFTPPDLESVPPHPDSLSLRPLDVAAIRPGDSIRTPPDPTHRQSQRSHSRSPAAPLVWSNLRSLTCPTRSGCCSPVASVRCSSPLPRWRSCAAASPERRGRGSRRRPGLRRVPWRAVGLIERDGEAVNIHIGDLAFTVPTVGIAGFRGGARSAEQLAYALRHAKERSATLAHQSAVDLPTVPVARTPLVVVISLYLVYVPLLAWALRLVSAH
jgi:hypothetical protein